MVYWYNRTLLSNKKEWNPDKCWAWINLKQIMLSGRRQLQKSMCCIIPFIWNTPEWQIHGDSRVVTAWGRGKRGHLVWKRLEGSCCANENGLKLHYSDGCTAQYIYENLLTCVCLKLVNFMVYKLYSNTIAKKLIHGKCLVSWKIGQILWTVNCWEINFFIRTMNIGIPIPKKIT